MTAADRKAWEIQRKAAAASANSVWSSRSGEGSPRLFSLIHHLALFSIAHGRYFISRAVRGEGAGIGDILKSMDQVTRPGQVILLLDFGLFPLFQGLLLQDGFWLKRKDKIRSHRENEEGKVWLGRRCRGSIPKGPQPDTNQVEDEWQRCQYTGGRPRLLSTVLVEVGGVVFVSERDLGPMLSRPAVSHCPPSSP